MVTMTYDAGPRNNIIPTVSIIIPTKNKLNLLKNCISSLKANAGADYEIIVVDGGDDDTWEWIEKQAGMTGVRAEADWNFSKINNEGARFATGEYILMLNNDIIARKGFLKEMLELMEDEQVGVVGAKLLHPDETIQHIGIFFDAFGTPYHPYWGEKESPAITLGNRNDEFDAVTGACLLTRRSLWETIGGLNEEYNFNYEDVDYCLKARELGYKIMLAYKAVLIHIEAASFDERKEKLNSIKNNLRIFAKNWIENKKINSIINKKVQVDFGPYKEQMLNLAFVPFSVDSGIGHWRIMMPARKIAENKMANVEIISHHTNDEKLRQVMAYADVAVYQGIFSQPILDMALLQDDRRFKMVYEFDDHPIYLSPWAQVYRVLGTQEVKMRGKDGRTYWLWRDGEAGFFLERNIQNITRQVMIIQNVNHVTTTTDSLKQYFETKNPNVTVLPNSIDFNVFKPMDFKDNGVVRIGWHGGDNHFHDVSEIGKELTEYINKTDNVKIVFFGGFYQGPFKGIDMNKVEQEPWVHVEAFPFKLRCLNINIGLVPLADETKYPFNKYKSDLKYCEYSALKIPTLVSANKTAYKDCKDGENCFTYATNLEFTEKIDRLVKDAECRKTLAEKAYDWCYEYRNLDKNYMLWLDLYKKLAEVSDGNSISDIPSGTVSADVRGVEG